MVAAKHLRLHVAVTADLHITRREDFCTHGGLCFSDAIWVKKLDNGWPKFSYIHVPELGHAVRQTDELQVGTAKPRFVVNVGGRRARYSSAQAYFEGTGCPALVGFGARIRLGVRKNTTTQHCTPRTSINCIFSVANNYK